MFVNAILQIHLHLKRIFRLTLFGVKICGWNLDIEEFTLSDNLKKELLEWVSEYGKWIVLETDSLKENELKLQENHNEKGLQLFQKVKKELGEKYPIIFVPSEPY